MHRLLTSPAMESVWWRYLIVRESTEPHQLRKQLCNSTTRRVDALVESISEVGVSSISVQGLCPGLFPEVPAAYLMVEPVVQPVDGGPLLRFSPGGRSHSDPEIVEVKGPHLKNGSSSK